MTTSELVRDIGLDAVIGMYPVTHRLRSTVVVPWAASGDPAVRVPHRVLVYGVPGSGVRFMARQLAEELTERTPACTVVMESFDDVAAADPAEVHSLLGGNETSDVVVIAVSHAPWNLPATLLEHDSFDRLTFVCPPDWDARRFRLWELSADSATSAELLDELLVATEGWAGSDLTALAASENRVAGSTLLERVTATTPASMDWLASAREMVLRQGSVGRFDDLVGYLERYRLI